MASKKFIYATLIIFWALQINNANAFTIEKYDEKVEGRFVVSPGKIELSVKPGDSINQEILVVNRLGEKIDFFVHTEEIGKGNVQAADGATASWIVPEVENFSLDQGERISFNAVINVPSDVSSLGNYFSILIGTKGQKTDGKDQIEVVSQIGVSAYITTIGGGNIEKRGSIYDFFVDKFFYRNGPVEFTAVFDNLGNVHLQPSGEISVYNFIGAKIAQLPLKEWVVLPNSNGKQSVVWNKKWLLGRYRAELLVKYGNEDGQMLRERLVFYAFPWHILILILLILTVIYYLIKHLRSKYEVRLHLKKGADKELDDTGKDD